MYKLKIINKIQKKKKKKKLNIQLLLLPQQMKINLDIHTLVVLIVQILNGESRVSHQKCQIQVSHQRYQIHLY